jgi:hypothetical protein
MERDFLVVPQDLPPQALLLLLSHTVTIYYFAFYSIILLPLLLVHFLFQASLAALARNFHANTFQEDELRSAVNQLLPSS